MKEDKSGEKLARIYEAEIR